MLLALIDRCIIDQYKTAVEGNLDGDIRRNI